MADVELRANVSVFSGVEIAGPRLGLFRALEPEVAGRRFRVPDSPEGVVILALVVIHSGAGQRAFVDFDLDLFGRGEGRQE